MFFRCVCVSGYQCRRTMGLSSWPRGYIQSLNELHWGPRRSYTSPFSHRKPSARVLPQASRLSRAASAWLLVATTTRIVPWQWVGVQTVFFWVNDSHTDVPMEVSLQSCWLSPSIDSRPPARWHPVTWSSEWTTAIMASMKGVYTNSNNGATK